MRLIPGLIFSRLSHPGVWNRIPDNARGGNPGWRVMAYLSLALISLRDETRMFHVKHSITNKLL